MGDGETTTDVVASGTAYREKAHLVLKREIERQEYWLDCLRMLEEMIDFEGLSATKDAALWEIFCRLTERR